MGDRSVDSDLRFTDRWGRFYDDARRVGLSDGEAIDWADAQCRPKPKPAVQPGLFTFEADGEVIVGKKAFS